MQAEEKKEPLKNSIGHMEVDKKIDGVTLTPKRTMAGNYKHWIVCFIVLIVLTLALIRYFYGTFYYGEHFFPNTIINDTICKNLTYEEALAVLKCQYDSSYQLTLIDKEGKEAFVILPADVGMKFSFEEGVRHLLEEQDKFRWPIYALSKKQNEYIVNVTVSYDDQMLRHFLQKIDLFRRTKEAEPKDAYISDYLDDINAYEVVKEVEGNYLNEESTVQKVKEAFTNLIKQLDLEAELCYEQPKVYADDKDLQIKLNQMNQYVSSCITYDWNGNTIILQGDTIQDWVILSDEDVSLDTEKIAAYIKENAKQYDTYGKKRKFITTAGVEITLPSGAYGWKTDREAESKELTDLIMRGSVVDREPIYLSQGWVKGSDDIGNSYVEIDITSQHLYIYLNGEIVLESDFVSGNMSNGNMTPAGVFGITYKKKNAVLRGEDYETPVNYWMPFNGNIGMHDATWRRKFGGDIYLNSGSHGCINLPLKYAAEIFEYVSKGFPVICYY